MNNGLTHGLKHQGPARARWRGARSNLRPVSPTTQDRVV